MKYIASTLLLTIGISVNTLYAQVITDANNNVGIGTSTPREKLDVNGNLIVSGAISSIISGNDIGGMIHLNNPAKTANGTASRWSIYNMSGNYGNSLQFWAYDNLNCANGGLCSSRFTLTDDGNVGIGIFNPSDQLHIKVGNSNNSGGVTVETPNVNGAGNPALSLRRGSEETFRIEGFPNVEGRLKAVAANLGFMTFYTGSNGEKMRLDASGNLGIGISAPEYKLDINGVNAVTDRFIKKSPSSGTANPTLLGAQTEWATGEIPIISLGYDQGAGSGTDMDTKIRSYARQPSDSHNFIVIGRNRIDLSAGTTYLTGNVGIGTSTPAEKLSVNGNILAKKVRVSQNWADFVFDSAYLLKPLAEVDDFIQANKHLPDMPSAKEIEAKGLDLGEIVKQQQVKIEELTLYLIELKKENTQLTDMKIMIQQQAVQIASLEKKLATVLQKIIR